MANKTLDVVQGHMLPTDTISVDANNVPNAVLRRLIEEVRHEHKNNVAEYNRTHNRHNRGR